MNSIIFRIRQLLFYLLLSNVLKIDNDRIIERHDEPTVEHANLPCFFRGFFAETVENMEPLERYDEPHYIEDSAAALLPFAEQCIEYGENDWIIERHDDSTVGHANLLCFFVETVKNMEPLDVVRRFLCKPQLSFKHVLHKIKTSLIIFSFLIVASFRFYILVF
jgi:hypothetical protein